MASPTLMLTLLAVLAVPVAAFQPKATAPIDLAVSALDTVKAGSPVRIRLYAVPRIDAPLLKLSWVIPAGVTLLSSGPATITTAARAGQGAELTVTVRLPDLNPVTFFAGAAIEQSGGGSRQVKAKALTLPYGVFPKSDPLPPVTTNQAGQPILEHLVPPSRAR